MAFRGKANVASGLGNPKPSTLAHDLCSALAQTCQERLVLHECYGLLAKREYASRALPYPTWRVRWT